MSFDEYKDGDEEKEKASKDEYKVAKWIRNNVPVKKTKFLNHNVEYFTSTKALDALMTSKFAQGDNCLFPTRQMAIDYLNMMLVHKFFHRAKKVTVSEMELRGGRTKEKVKEQEKKETDAESSHAENKKEEKEKPSEKITEKKKRKIRLEMHPQQIFLDGHEAYVWIYDPIPMTYWIFGALVVIGAIVICLFPLWPPQLRTGVYYLSMTAAGFLVFLLALVVVRFILFCVIWICSGGKHHFWFLPNLTEDVGFLDSFKPLYKHDYIDGSDAKGKKDKDKKKKKKKDSDDEGGDKVTEPTQDTSKSKKTTDNVTEESTLRQRKVVTESAADENKGDEERKLSESESSDSQRSSTGKDFEIVDAEEDEE
ncbi:hypothetical protein ACKWTF_000064 [Chironomus riparius]